MTTTVTREECERRLRSTFHEKADQIAVRAQGFDPGPELTASVPLVDATPSQPRRRSPRRTALALAAVVLMVAVAVGVVSRTGWLAGDPSDGARVRTGPSQETTVTTAPVEPSEPTEPTEPSESSTNAHLAPTSLPSGMELWSADVEVTGGATAFTSSQLFGALDSSGALAPAILVETQPASPGSVVRPDGPADATVRGHVVTIDPAKDGGAGTEEFAWIEGDAEVRVTIRNTTPARAIEILDGLRPRGASMTAGFDPSSAPSGITQLADSTKPSVDPGLATFTYGRGAPGSGGQPVLTVRTTTGPTYPGYARTWIAGSRADDGLAVEFDPGVGAIVVWPDGRQAVASSTSLDQATLVEIARRVRPLDRAGERRLIEGLSERTETAN